MKKLLFMIAFLSITTLNAQDINQVVEYDGNKKMLLGKVNRLAFKNKEFDWFQKNYYDYLSNDKIIAKIKDNNINDYKIKVFFGSWCGDSKTNLPIFYKVMEEAGFDTKNMEVIALDRRKGSYKQSPTHEEKGLNIHRVPTFIFYKDGKEINRIVEHPHETFERDILNILTNEKQSLSYYKVAHYISDTWESKPIDSLYQNIDNIAIFLSNHVKGSSELNTFGKVLLEAKEYPKAQFLLELNAKIFPYQARVYDSLGDLYSKKEEYKKALKNYYQALSIKPDNEQILKKIEEINKKTKD